MMDENIFMKEKKPISFEDYLEYDENSRGNLGGELPVIVYRLLEYSIKDELAVRYGRAKQIEIFRNAGRKAGEFFARKMLNLNQPLDQFVGELQKKMAEMKIGVLRIESVDEESGQIILTVSEDADCSGLPVLGYLPESEEYRMESRHLGLFLPGEIDRLRERIGRLADQMEKSIAVERVLEVAGMLPLRIENKEKEKAENESMEAESIAKFPACQEQKVTSRVRIGVARDEAFCFYYQENLHLLEQMGAELVYFSPLRDKKIPDRVDGLLFGGGYPENYARELAKNAAMRESIRRSIAAGMPFLAECGGFLYLHRTLEGSDGKHWEMAGVYPFDAYRTNRLRRFGYVRLLTSSGQEIHGHEFHYWESEDPGTDWEAVKPTGNRSWRCIHEKGGQIGGFPHLYYASCPDFLRKWLDVCAKGSQKKYIN